MDTPAVFLVGTQPPPELDDKFNKWYNGTHVPMLLKSNHLLGVTRYRLSPATQGEYPAYLAIYLFKDRKGFEAWGSGPEMLAAREERKQSWKGGKDDFETKWRVLYEPLKRWSKDKPEKMPFVFVVGTQPSPEMDDKYNNWYNGTHIPQLLPCEHLRGATRYKILPGTQGEYPAYIALYDFRNLKGFEAWYSGPEVKAASDNRKDTWADKDFEVKWLALYEPLKTWSK